MCRWCPALVGLLQRALDRLAPHIPSSASASGSGLHMTTPDRSPSASGARIIRRGRLDVWYSTTGAGTPSAGGRSLVPSSMPSRAPAPPGSPATRACSAGRGSPSPRRTPPRPGSGQSSRRWRRRRTALRTSQPCAPRWTPRFRGTGHADARGTATTIVAATVVVPQPRSASAGAKVGRALADAALQARSRAPRGRRGTARRAAALAHLVRRGNGAGHADRRLGRGATSRFCG